MAEYDPPKPPAPEPQAEPDPGPDVDALLAEERAKAAEAEAKLKENQINYDARMSQLESMLQNKFAEKPAPPPAEAPVASVTAEDYLTPEGSLAASQKLAQQAAASAVQAVDSTYKDTIMATRAAQFDMKLEGLKSRKYFEHVEEKLNAAIAGNPKLRYAPEALDILYKNLVGDSMDDILAAASQSAPPDPGTPVPVRSEVIQRRTNVAAPTGPASAPVNEGTGLSAAEASVRSKFAPYINRMRKDGTQYTDEDYARSKAERQGEGVRAEIPDLEERRG
jgi:hypothetical protein